MRSQAAERPWHEALIAERAAGFYLAHGLDQAGHELLAQARRHYAAWGASAKVAQLDWAYPTLRPPSDAVTTTGTVDLLGILAASQALSAQTSIAGLHARVVDVLGAMTGATGVHMLLWSEDRRDWLRPVAPADAASDERTAPLSVLRYVQRTREPLVVDDATRDDRFARDTYLAELESCSLLAVPILSRGMLRAVLLLENRLIRGRIHHRAARRRQADRRPARRLPRQRREPRATDHVARADRRRRRRSAQADPTRSA